MVRCGGRALSSTKLGLSIRYFQRSTNSFSPFHQKWTGSLLTLDKPEVAPQNCHREGRPLGTGLAMPSKSIKLEKWFFTGLGSEVFLVRTWAPCALQLYSWCFGRLDLEVIISVNPRSADREISYIPSMRIWPSSLKGATISFEKWNCKKVPLALASRIVPFTYSLFYNKENWVIEDWAAINFGVGWQLLILSTSRTSMKCLFLDLQQWFGNCENFFTLDCSLTKRWFLPKQLLKPSMNRRAKEGRKEKACNLEASVRQNSSEIYKIFTRSGQKIGDSFSLQKCADGLWWNLISSERK